MTTDLEISYQAMLVYVDIQMLKKLFRSFIGQFLPDILRQVQAPRVCFLEPRIIHLIPVP